MTPAERLEQVREQHKEFGRLSFSSDGADFPRYRQLMRELALSGVSVLLKQLENLEARVKELESKQ